MGKQNCWEMRDCGREPGGAFSRELGVCPAAAEQVSEGRNSGTGHGRSCWRIVGTYCGGQLQASLGAKMRQCPSCSVLKRVKEEEGERFQV